MAVDLYALINSLSIGSSVGRATIEKEGFLQFEGQGIAYRDEYAGSSWLPASAQAAPDETNVTIGGVATRLYAFDGGNTEERLSNQFEIAHDMVIDKVNDGTFKIEWHVHFAPSNNNAGNVKWFFDWCYIPPNGAPIEMTTSTAIKAVTNNSGNNMLVGSELPVPAGGYNIGGLILFNLRRTPTDEQDTYGSDVYLLKCALHIPVDTNGSRERYSKDRT